MSHGLRRFSIAVLHSIRFIVEDEAKCVNVFALLLPGLNAAAAAYAAFAVAFPLESRRV